MPRPPPLLPASDYQADPDPDANEVLVGSPRRVAEQVALMRDAGVRNLMLTNRGLLSRELTTSSLRLLSQKVVPAVQVRADWPWRFFQGRGLGPAGDAGRHPSPFTAFH